MREKRRFFPKVRPRCLFCERNDTLTHEHIIPRWLEPILHPPINSEPHINRMQRPLDKSFTEISQKRLLKKILWVCRGCNNVRLSALEELAKPLVSSLVSLQERTFNVGEQTLLAAWLAKTLMVSEFREPSQVTVPQKDRRYLIDTLQAPSTWQIWIYHTDQTGLDHYHYSALIGRNVRDPETISGDNIQSSSIRFGRVMVTSISDNFPFHRASVTRKLAQYCPRIWPLSASSLPWPPTRALTKEETDNFVDFLVRQHEREIAAGRALPVSRANEVD
jgi:hypothetical protein